MLRLINSDSIQNYYVSMPSYLIKHASFDISNLGSVTSYDQLLAALKKTDYYKILDKYRPQNGQQINITICETALLTHYFKKVFETIDAEQHGAAKKELKMLFSMQIDIYNFSVAYRLRRFFNASPEETRSCLLPFDTKSKKTIEAIVQAPSKDDLPGIIAKSRYSKDQQMDDMEYIESLVERTRYRTSTKDMRFSTNPAVVLTSYMLLCNIEWSNIINIVEGIRYGLDTADIRKLLTN